MLSFPHILEGILLKWFKFPKRSFYSVISRLISWIWTVAMERRKKYIFSLLPAFQFQILQLKVTVVIYILLCHHNLGHNAIMYFSCIIQSQSSRFYLQNLTITLKNRLAIWNILHKWKRTLCPGKILIGDYGTICLA